MCGIIAYQGFRDAGVVVLRGLKKLEYRGYDSWGIGVLKEHHFIIKKNPGQISAIGECDFKQVGSRLGLGHTRWATHGGVTRANAHPHLSTDGRLAVVQNGIVENFLELKAKLKAKGYIFKSETDTEVIANLIESELKKLKTSRDPEKNLRSAVRLAFLKLNGRNAIVVLDKVTGVIVAARQGSPLIVGVGKKEYFIASDIPAFLEYTNQVMYLDDGQMVVLSDGEKKKHYQAKFYDIARGVEIKRRLIRVDLKAEIAEKGKYLHFMIKEIMEQKDTIRRAVSQDDREIRKIARMIRQAYGTFSVACGTAGYAAMIGEYLFAKVAKRHLNFSVASEFAAYEPFLTDKTLMLVTSQSGETADVLEAMEAARRQKVKIVSLVNVPGSTIAKKSDHTFFIKAGPEHAVASTKAATSQIALHTLLAYACAERLSEGKALLVNAAGQVNDMLNPRYGQHLYRLAQKIQKADHLYVIGRGLMYPVALEIALKIKEVSYIHADGLSAGELKHGTIALISPGTPCIVVVANDENREAILSNAQEVKARGAYIIGIATENQSVFDYFIRVPDVGLAAPIASIIPGQILAYHLAVLRGCDPDKPRNLAKSVTVK
ncbi:MAG: hypothetical protein A2445_00950 [Candidatus Jacksonbacteria bacterium RIFOXYC2_FULL_44_29]|nr:MAG: Glucosamine/fructose-6-phosphate aminotransferase, isomerizing [Parcubacteria group bacterium GW2011_GWC2_44_22]OGY74658.1 MAG: hypothetical protein A2240_06085 [Candidatus Jacksonbacteria bacterium RIFOXYA2_FULL_43_12]OGY75361.1 MAG: hypothetical protein A2295_04250 [Candidatus Jacksonbacteria bacterium RIFOXYB2_FULL_44_15]OGY77354.1 MAG: hypothetical protein A2445_00950 [Candidatus Jacksonbacteria bacterium RIFOXYC2_FULL_44_29]OGY82028.1 MAG: hypothetical protein A2550_00455 [Candidat